MARDAQFTYDFGIAIAQSTVNKVARLAGVSLTLASAFYSLQQVSEKYVNTLRENTLRFGGMVSTIRAMEQAQDRLVKGQSYFDMDDQLAGMNKLMSVGLDVKKNMDFINKAAHATGKSYAEFSGMVASAIQGNTGALVEAGLMTARSVKMFEKYQGNTRMMQGAIMSFLKNHKGLMTAIAQDFETIQDQTRRLKAVWTSFAQAIIGKPNDPGSLYGQIVSSMKMIAESFANNIDQIKARGFVIGQVMGWIVRNIGHTIKWLGGKLKAALDSIWKVTDNFKDQARSMIVWLEFWKLAILDFFKEYKKEIMFIGKLLLSWLVLKKVFALWDVASIGVLKYAKNLKDVTRKYRMFRNLLYSRTGGEMRILNEVRALGVFLPKTFRKVYLGVTRALYPVNIFFRDVRYVHIPRLVKSIKGIPSALVSAMKNAGTMTKSLFVNAGNIMKASAHSVYTATAGVLKNFTSIKGASQAIGNGFKSAGSFLLNLPSLFMGALRSFAAASQAIMATNPVGWITIAIALFIALYIKCEKFRDLVHSAVVFLVEWWRFLWNIVAWVITKVMTSCIRLWRGIKKIGSNIVSGIKRMWAYFKDSSVGKWIDETLIQPIKKAFEWIKNIWQKISEIIGKAAKFLGMASDSIAQSTSEEAKQFGVVDLSWNSGGKGTVLNNKQLEDGFQNLSENFGDIFGGGGKKDRNPIMDAKATASAKSLDTGSGTTNNLSFANGAIQIVVGKDSGFDERKLANLVRETIMDMERTNSLRGGMG